MKRRKPRNLLFWTIIFFIVVEVDLAIAELSCLDNGEIIIYNRYADGVTVKMIPVGSIFSGVLSPDHCGYNGLDRKYSLRPGCRYPNPPITNWTYIVGGGRTMDLFPPPPPNYQCGIGGYAVYDWDDGANYDWEHPQFVAGAVSYGLWKVEFWYIPAEGPPTLVNYCWLDYRDWRVGSTPTGCPNNNYDIQLELRTDNLYSRWGNWLDDMLGREVFSMNEFMAAGEHEFKFNGTNFASELYYYRIESNGFVESKKMLLLK